MSVHLEILERHLAELGAPRVLIVGDVMLDRYVTGEASRISPEAPIPILTATSAEERLGGAGNVASNLRVMGAEVELVGVIGDDGWGRALRDGLIAAGLDPAGLVVDPARPTSLKTRMVSGVQQMLRVDWEDSAAVSGEALEALLERALERVASCDAVVLSDYGKGVLTDGVLRAVIDAARAAGKPVLVDPKGSDFSRYRGATLITPNRKEAEAALGRRLPDLAAVSAGAAELIEAAELEVAIITLGAEGIYYRARDGREGRESTRARAVFDVTGAGDTVVGHLALHLAAGHDLEVAVALANHAAGCVVARLGTNAVTREELAARLRETAPHEGKVLHGTELEQLLAAWRRDGKRVVFTNGCFDIIHSGHVSYLRFARSHGDVLLVGVNDDASVRRLKGPDRPVNPVEDRLEVLAAMEMVDAVVAFGEDTPAALVERVTPDVLVKGEDWAEKGVVGREWVEKHGGQVVLAPLVQGRSTTRIIERARGAEERG
jgi:D-beta-D-heptose 7-phosphate kinase/D-beta-D-heptose 1-phosphate adenosyltransferase